MQRLHRPAGSLLAAVERQRVALPAGHVASPVALDSLGRAASAEGRHRPLPRARGLDPDLAALVAVAQLGVDREAAQDVSTVAATLRCTLRRCQSIISM